jgi:hypothetical protein
MTITSQAPSADPSSFAARAANTATLGIGGALRSVISESEATPRGRLEDLRLSEPLRELLDRAFRTRLGGSVQHTPVDSEIGKQLQIQYTVARAPALEVVFLQLPGSILKDGNQIRQLLTLTFILRGKTVRVVSLDLNGEPSSSFHGLKRLWEEEEEKEEKQIHLDFIPLSHLEELDQGKGDLDNVLKLESRASPLKNATEKAGAILGRKEDGKSYHIVRIFLASSAELRDDRDEFELYFREKNDQYLPEGYYLEVVRWEHFLDAMSETRMQDEYNAAVRDCDIFVSLFFTKTGKFTEEEFDTAHRHFKATGRPRIYTFFKNADLKSGEITDEVMSLLKFKKKLQELEHFYTGYDNIEHLKRQFRDQLDILLKPHG